VVWLWFQIAGGFWVVAACAGCLCVCSPSRSQTAKRGRRRHHQDHSTHFGAVVGKPVKHKHVGEAVQVAKRGLTVEHEGAARGGVGLGLRL